MEAGGCFFACSLPARCVEHEPDSSFFFGHFTLTVGAHTYIVLFNAYYEYMQLNASLNCWDFNWYQTSEE